MEKDRDGEDGLGCPQRRERDFLRYPLSAFHSLTVPPSSALPPVATIVSPAQNVTYCPWDPRDSLDVVDVNLCTREVFEMFSFLLNL